MPGALSCSEVIGVDVRATLWELRRLRVSQHRHADLSSDYLYMACKGVGAQKALDIGGTGDCPLTNYSDAYEIEHRLAKESKDKADAIWATILPLLDSIVTLDYDARQVIILYYNTGISREDIPALIKRSVPACDRMYHEALAKIGSAESVR